MLNSVHNEHYIHLVWATWDRLPLLVPGIREQVYAGIKTKCQELRCPVHALGGTEDHVHLVVQLHPTVPTYLLVKDVKGASSHLTTHAVAPSTFFKWQGGYAVFGLSSEGLPAIVRYVHNQEEHHRNSTEDPHLEPRRRTP